MISYKIKIHLAKVVSCISNNHLIENVVGETTLTIATTKTHEHQKWAGFI